MIRRLLLLCCLFPALLLWAGQATAASGPLSAVTDAQAAVDAADRDAFNTAVDVDSVLQKGLTEGVDLLCARAARGETANLPPVLALAMASAAQDCKPDNPQLVVLRALLLTESKNFVGAGVGGGYFAGKPNGRVQPNALQSQLLQKMSSARKELVPGRVLAQQGDTAEVSATLHDAEAGTFPLRLKVERKNTTWRIVEVLNVRDLVDGALAKHH